MSEEDVKINHIVGAVDDLDDTQCGIDGSAHGTTGNKHWNYVDDDGNPHRCANIEEPAAFTDLTVTGTTTGITVAHDDTTDKDSNPNFQHVTASEITDISDLKSGTTNYQLVTTATADIAVTTSIVGVDCDTVGAACTLTALTAGLVAGRKITVIAFGTDINTVSVVGEGGELLNGASSVQIVNDNRTLTLRVVDGGYNVVNPADAQSIWENPIEELADTESADGGTIPTTDKDLGEVMVSNLFLQRANMSLSPWNLTRLTMDRTTGGTTPGGEQYNGFIGDNDSGTPTSHACGQVYTMASAGRLTVCGFFVADSEEWMRVRNASSAKITDFNIATGEIGTVSTTSGGIFKYKVLHSGHIRICVEMDGVSGSNNMLFYPCTDDGNINYDADGSTVAAWIGEISLFAGTIDENIESIETTTAAVEAQKRYIHRIDKAKKWDDGLIQDAGSDGGDGWTATPVDGEPYRPRGSNDYELRRYIDGNMAGQTDKFEHSFRLVTTGSVGGSTDTATFEPPCTLASGEMYALKTLISGTVRDGGGSIKIERHDNILADGEVKGTPVVWIDSATTGAAGISALSTDIYSDAGEIVFSVSQTMSASVEQTVDWVIVSTGVLHTDAGVYC